MQVCPTDVVFAPAGRIWLLLMDRASWLGETVLGRPDRRARSSD